LRFMPLNAQLAVQEVEQLRQRWLEQAGKSVIAEMVAIWQRDSRNWRNLVADLAPVSVAPNYPDLLTDLRGLMLDGVCIPNVALPYVDLSYAVIRNSDLDGICLQGSMLTRATFDNCQMKGADLLQVIADHSSYDRCNLELARMDLGDFRFCTFRRTNMTDIDLDGANMRGSRLV